MPVILLANQKDHHRFSILLTCHAKTRPIALPIRGASLVPSFRIWEQTDTCPISVGGPVISQVPWRVCSAGRHSPRRSAGPATVPIALSDSPRRGGDHSPLPFRQDQEPRAFVDRTGVRRGRLVRG